MRTGLVAVTAILVLFALLGSTRAQATGDVYYYLKVTFNNCPRPVDFIESLDDASIYQVTWVPGGNCTKKRASTSVLTLASNQATAEAQRNSLEAAQDSAVASTGVAKAQITDGPANKDPGLSDGRYPTWSAIVMIVLIFIMALAICLFGFLIWKKGGSNERSGNYTKLETS